VIGRYISENYNGTALHPIDFIDASNGQLVAEVMDPNITTITPVNKLHPRDDVLASGSSRFGIHYPTATIVTVGGHFFLLTDLSLVWIWFRNPVLQVAVHLEATG